MTATLVNHTDRAATGKISGEMDGGITFSREYSLAPKETREVGFNDKSTSALVIKNPRIWWPSNLGAPELYTLKLNVQDARGTSDARRVTFGIREVADYVSKEGYRGLPHQWQESV